MEVDKDALGSTWRSDSGKPLVAILETFPDPYEKPALSGAYQPIQVPNHGWIIPKAIVSGAPTNDEAGRVGSATLWVASAHYYMGLLPSDKEPPAGGDVNPEAPPPVLAKQSAYHADPLGVDVPVVYKFQCEGNDKADEYAWQFGLDGDAGVPLTTKEPFVYVWFQDGNNDLSPTGDTERTPVILGLLEDDSADLRSVWKFSVQPRDSTKSGTEGNVGALLDATFRVATRKSRGLGPSEIPLTAVALAGRFTEPAKYDFPDREENNDDFFGDPPDDVKTDDDEDIKKLEDSYRRLIVRNFKEQLLTIKVNLSEYWDPEKNEPFGLDQRVLWLGAESTIVALTLNQKREYWDVYDMITVSPRDEAGMRFKRLRSYGIALSKLHQETHNEADLAQIVMGHEWFHVRERNALHLWDPPGEPLDPEFHGALMGRGIEAFRRLYRVDTEPERDRRAIQGYEAFLAAHGEIGPLSHEIEVFGSEGAASFHTYHRVSRQFVNHFNHAVRGSFSRFNAEKDYLVAGNDLDGAVRTMLLRYFQAVYDMAIQRFPSMEGDRLSVVSLDFIDKLSKAGTDEAHPYVIFRPY